METLGAGLLLFGMMLQAGFTLVTLKLIVILFVFVFTGPVVTHALAQAALHENVQPLLAEDRRRRSKTGAAS
jgi:multicomponent Na+:H+ antiporter subunit G